MPRAKAEGLSREAFSIAGTVIAPSERKLVHLPIPQLYIDTALSMPAQVIHGEKPGPRLFVCAAIHGDEINGTEIIRRLVNLKALRRIKGTLIAVPVVNVYGFIHRSRYLPDRRDLNRSFPGSETGSLAARLAHVFMNEVAARCTHGIDLHTGALHRDNLPQLRANVDDEETERMARAFPVPVLINTRLAAGSLRHALSTMGIPILVYEAGEALRFDEAAIRTGVRGIVSVMRELRMLPKARGNKTTMSILSARASNWIRAPRSGILRSRVALGAKVAKGQVLGVVADPFGGDPKQVRAHAAGIVVGRTKLPLVMDGAALFHLARFDRLDVAAEKVESFQYEHDPASDAKAPREPPIV